MNNKQKVKNFWEEASCGEDLYLKGFNKEDYLLQSKIRYELEPQIIEFAEFKKFNSLKTLEIGVGLGSDHMMLAKNGAILSGVDFTERAIAHTKRRFKLLDLNSELQIGDAENLPYKDKSFDSIYSWGVIHHSPNTQKSINEIYRVLKKGGFAKIMIYNKHSLVGYMLWIRYALMKLKPHKNLREIYSKFLESPGTQAFSRIEAKAMLNKFKIISIDCPLTHADLLTSKAGQRHEGLLLTTARFFWPRWFFKLFMKNFGLGMMIHVVKK